jgi:hypothetical protein
MKTHLKGNEPHALYRIRDDKQVLQAPKGCDVNAGIKKRYANQSLIEIKCPHEHLQFVKSAKLWTSYSVPFVP